ncbi:MAG: DUF86 domain-containing protein [Gammaproteobacteria bacterium]|nr:DUF86 domain-containing protein [Gammaproteobacteria bacterium]
MRPEIKKYLYDVKQAADLVADFTSGKTLQDYKCDAMLSAAVEREFEIIGEALNHTAKMDEAVAKKITGYRRIIAFRNILIHGYASVDDQLVWDIVENKLPVLREEVEKLLFE